jgi:hypothetical protein
MPLSNYEAEIAAFIRANGVTCCPTACAAPSQASGNAADRAALRRRADQFEAARIEKIREASLRAPISVWELTSSLRAAGSDHSLLTDIGRRVRHIQAG